MAQTSPNAPPKPPVDAAPSVSGPDGVTVPLEIMAPPLIAPDRVVIQVGDVKITAGQLSQILEGYSDSQKVFVNGPGRQQFIDQVVRLMVLAEEGRRRKLTETDIYKNQVWYSATGLLANQTDTDIRLKVHGDEALLRAYYEVHKAEYEQVQASHILIRMQGSGISVAPGQKDLTEEEALAKAQEVRKKIIEGADFAALARVDSDDMGSSAKGGDLGFLRHGQTVPSFEDALFALEVGQLSQPVKTQFGYHLIKIVDRKPTKTFEELRPELEKAVENEASRKFLAELKAKSKIVIDPEFSEPAKALVGVK
ncbi:MAG: peptidylprolyl isomerase [Candidatus Solibacter sp.]